MDTVAVLCEALKWNIQDLSHEARIAWATARDAIEGKEPSQRTKRDIAQAFSKAFGREYTLADIEWRKEN